MTATSISSLSMWYYFIFYSLSVILCLILWIQIFKRYKNISWFFFALFTFFASVWCTFYYLFFTWSSEPNILTYISRSAFYFWMVSIYSLLLFVYFFKTRTEKIFTKYTIWALICFVLLWYIYIATDKIISWMHLTGGVYREVYGELYMLSTVLYVIFIIAFIILAKQKIQSQEWLNKIRLRRIIWAGSISTFWLIFLLVFLPTFWIWIIERWLIFLYVFFVIYTFFTLRKYYFLSVSYSLWKILVWILSWVVAIAIMNLLKYYFLILHTGKVVSYWWWNDEFSIIDSIIVILIYIVFYRYIWTGMLWDPSIIKIKDAIRGLEKQISKFTDMESVEKVLNKWLHHSFHTGRAYIHLFNPEETESNELQRFFLKESKHDLFISDIAFMDDHRKDYDLTKIEKQIPKDIILIIPLYSTSNINIWWLFIGKKPFWDFYTEDEIKTLKEFAFFLETHLKYIRVYNMLRDMTENLDKRVDEKTLEYNDLINRQKDFIRMISHEIRSPIGSAIFQSDSIIDDIEAWEYDKNHIKEELNILSEQLVKTGEILTKLFSVEYYDVHSVSLFRENIDIYGLFDEEIKISMKANPKIHFINGIDKNIGFASIDKIQFRQVITNLVSNAIKFATNKKPTIIIEWYKKDGYIRIWIEDNGPGFDGIDTSSVFDKYTIGKWNRVWLWMWLYLCKRIIEMHGWHIHAGTGNHLGWARFTLVVPIEQNT